MKIVMNIHDSNIIGILIDDGKNIRLILEDSTKRTLIFTNAIRMKIVCATLLLPGHRLRSIRGC